MLILPAVLLALGGRAIEANAASDGVNFAASHAFLRVNAAAFSGRGAGGFRGPVFIGGDGDAREAHGHNEGEKAGSVAHCFFSGLVEDGRRGNGRKHV